MQATMQNRNDVLQINWQFAVQDSIYCTQRPCVVIERRAFEKRLRYLVEFSDRSRTWADEWQLSSDPKAEPGRAPDTMPAFQSAFSTQAQLRKALKLNNPDLTDAELDRIVKTPDKKESPKKEPVAATK